MPFSCLPPFKVSERIIEAEDVRDVEQNKLFATQKITPAKSRMALMQYECEDQPSVSFAPM
jgi:hypothetical protein